MIQTETIVQIHNASIAASTTVSSEFIPCVGLPHLRGICGGNSQDVVVRIQELGTEDVTSLVGEIVATEDFLVLSGKPLKLDYLVSGSGVRIQLVNTSTTTATNCKAFFALRALY